MKSERKYTLKFVLQSGILLKLQLVAKYVFIFCLYTGNIFPLTNFLDVHALRIVIL